MEVCKGLAYAHDAVHPETGRPLGIVHRDVSPPNVLLSRNGEVKLTDFGLAKAAVQVETTDPGVVKGKMSYLSPEAARGEEVDRRADIFAVGILLYEMLTGKRLFYGETDYQTVELVRAAKHPAHRTAEPRGGAGARGDRAQVAGPPARRSLPERHRSAGRAGAVPVLARAEDDPAGHRRSGAQLHRGHRRRCGRRAQAARPNIIDTLLQDEIQSFTSVEFEGEGRRGRVDDRHELAAGGARHAQRRLHRPARMGGRHRPASPPALQQATSRKPTGDVRVKQPSSEGQRVPAPPTGAPPPPPAAAVPPRPPAVPARSRRAPTQPSPASRPRLATTRSTNPASTQHPHPTSWPRSWSPAVR